ncbi:hypothetical protein LOD99_11338 [Oopsacas minuta]|uniref:Uncharacterized protein n=1 Tax=Oopsacas minuta TaxID=111878 RepID=A0AAV7K4A5_9METZ|nr:hypothetical protein LOD99_11338 [Oopsacas minuta]
MTLSGILICRKKSRTSCIKASKKEFTHQNVIVSSYREPNFDLAQYFTFDGPLCYSNGTDRLISSLSQEHSSFDWRLYIDSSKRSLKAVLVRNGNKNPAIPIAQPVYLKESYMNLEEVLDAIKYRTHRWNICGDLKVIGL